MNLPLLPGQLTAECFSLAQKGAQLVWIARHREQADLLIGAVVGLHKGLNMSVGGIDEI